MLSGLLQPTLGEIRVLGHIPFRRSREFLSRISLAMGQRNQLVWDIPALESLELNRAIYRISRNDYRHTLSELTDLLQLGQLLHRPVRSLSLGERMRCEMAAALLHRPRVLFLDEPTLGLDISMQRQVRSFITDYNRRYETTVLLTTHYMADVEALCRRVILLDRGKILFDGALSHLVESFTGWKRITLKIEGPRSNLGRFGQIISTEDDRVTFAMPQSQVTETLRALLAEEDVYDLTVQDSPIEDIIERVFSKNPPGETQPLVWQ